LAQNPTPPTGTLTSTHLPTLQEGDCFRTVLTGSGNLELLGEELVILVDLQAERREGGRGGEGRTSHLTSSNNGNMYLRLNGTSRAGYASQSMRIDVAGIFPCPPTALDTLVSTIVSRYVTLTKWVWLSQCVCVCGGGGGGPVHKNRHRASGFHTEGGPGIPTP
jgi:hypothetical protein